MTEAPFAYGGKQGSPWRDARNDPPPYGQRVLVVDHDKVAGAYLLFGVRVHSQEEGDHFEPDDNYGSGWDCREVSHWMPVPELPRPRRKKKSK